MSCVLSEACAYETSICGRRQNLRRVLHTFTGWNRLQIIRQLQKDCGQYQSPRSEAACKSSHNSLSATTISLRCTRENMRERPCNASSARYASYAAFQKLRAHTRYFACSCVLRMRMCNVVVAHFLHAHNQHHLVLGGVGVTRVDAQLKLSTT